MTSDIARDGQPRTADELAPAHRDPAHLAASGPDRDHPAASGPDRDHPAASRPDRDHPAASRPDPDHPAASRPDRDHPAASRPDPDHSALSFLECSRCSDRYDTGQLQGTCACGAPLLARYDLKRAGALTSPRQIATRPATLWRYHELLPVGSARAEVGFGEGMTPLLPMGRLGTELGLPRLLMKDESPLPTGSFKARGAAVGVSRAAELGAAGVALPTNGNAGSAWAAYAARAGLPCLVVMPADAPEITRAECVAAGAETYLVDGLIGDAGRLVRSAVADRAGYLDASTLREPYRLEGKKTIGLEIAEQLGWRVPDVIMFPTGGGVGLAGIWKGLLELRQLGWIGQAMPRLVAVQAAGCAPIVRAFERRASETEPWPDARTEAFGLTVPDPLGGFLVLRAVTATAGTAVAVTDEQLLASEQLAARTEGTWICPEGAACLAAAAQLRAEGWLTESDEVVVVNTGAGLKYPQTMPAHPPLLPADAHIPA
ncbi:MAG TPA: threonine synthase [Streptosporangiaceae bacterium]|nr:threonine synthase [Streptosporangiaceae bacterium]